MTFILTGEIGSFVEVWGFLSTLQGFTLKEGFLEPSEILEKALREHAGSVHLVSYSALVRPEEEREDPVTVSSSHTLALGG